MGIEPTRIMMPATAAARPASIKAEARTHLAMRRASVPGLVIFGRQTSPDTKLVFTLYPPAHRWASGYWCPLGPVSSPHGTARCPLFRRPEGPDGSPEVVARRRASPVHTHRSSGRIPIAAFPCAPRARSILARWRGLEPHSTQPHQHALRPVGVSARRRQPAHYFPGVPSGLPLRFTVYA